jgi:hypothetical protein
LLPFPSNNPGTIGLRCLQPILMPPSLFEKFVLYRPEQHQSCKKAIPQAV